MNFTMPIGITLNDIVQIVVLYFAIYWCLKAAHGSRFGQVLTGVGILFGVSLAFTFIFKFDVLVHILQGLLFYLALSSVVIFQPEIRRILATIGSLLFQDSHNRFEGNRVTAEDVANWLFYLADHHIGALIAFERGISLRGYEMTGVKLDAVLSRELLESIFTEPLPMHDGGLVIRHGRVSSAHCIFPVSNQSELSSSGMRHRAAVGLSEETDALIVVVSEERGVLALAHNGKLVRFKNPKEDPSVRQAILRRLGKALEVRQSMLEVAANWVKRRIERAKKKNEKLAIEVKA